MIRNALFILTIVITSCQKLQPESIIVSDYPDFKYLLENQVALLGNQGARKEVLLDTSSEVKSMEMDSVRWTKELEFLLELNPNQSGYSGAFNITSEDELELLTLKPGEKGALKKIRIQKEGKNFKSLEATYHEAKDVYTHHREVMMQFKNGMLNEYTIDGYQKMLFKDTIRFRITITLD